MDATNLLKLLRAANIFGPQPIQGIAGPYEGTDIGGINLQPSPDNTYGTPRQEDASNRFEDLMGSYPPEYKPSKARRFGSFFVGLDRGPEAQRDYLYAPRDRQIADWKNQVVPAASAATQERLMNKDVSTAAIQTERLKIQADRASVYKYKSEHPNHQFKENDKGEIVALNPQDGRGFIVTDADGNPIKSDKLSPEDKQNLQIELIKARGAESRETETFRQTNRAANIEAQGEQSRKTKETIPGKAAGSTTGELPTQTKVRQYLKAREAYNTHPEWQKYIKLGQPGTNDFTVVAPSHGRFFSTGPSDEEYNKMIAYIGASNASPALQPAEDAKIKVINPKGQTVMIPFKQWKDAEKQGYKKAY